MLVGKQDITVIETRFAIVGTSRPLTMKSVPVQYKPICPLARPVKVLTHCNNCRDKSSLVEPVEESWIASLTNLGDRKRHLVRVLVIKELHNGQELTTPIRIQVSFLLTAYSEWVKRSLRNHHTHSVLFCMRRTPVMPQWRKLEVPTSTVIRLSTQLRASSNYYSQVTLCGNRSITLHRWMLR